MPISGMIITYNEAAIIEKPIRSLQEFCDEVVILDSYSIDNTRAICKSLGAKVYQYEFDNFRDQKNRAISKCNNEWIFVLDADEWCNPMLIKGLSNDRNMDIAQDIDCFRYCRYNIERGEERVGWPDRQTRLFRKYIKHSGNPIHPDLTGYKNRHDAVEDMFIYHQKSYDRQEDRYRMYYTLRAMDYKPFRLPDNIDTTKANYEDRPYIDAWTEWYKRERKYNDNEPRLY